MELTMIVKLYYNREISYGLPRELVAQQKSSRRLDILRENTKQLG